MSRQHVRLGWIVILASGLILFVGHSARTLIAQPADAHADASKFQLQRLETAKEGANLAEQMYEKGVCEVGVLLTWQQRVNTTELALAKTRDERIAVLKRDVERALKAEALALTRVKAGMATPLDELAAKYDRLEAQAALAGEAP